MVNDPNLVKSKLIHYISDTKGHLPLETFFHPRGFKMDYSMQIIQRQCAKYLEMFAECMHEYPYTWQTDCEGARAKLAKCAENNPEIKFIKSTCREQFQIYERCMENNQVDPEKCTESYEKFSLCAEKALQTIHASEKSPAPMDTQKAS